MWLSVVLSLCLFCVAAIFDIVVLLIKFSTMLRMSYQVERAPETGHAPETVTFSAPGHKAVSIHGTENAPAIEAALGPVTAPEIDTTTKIVPAHIPESHPAPEAAHVPVTGPESATAPITSPETATAPERVFVSTTISESVIPPATVAAHKAAIESMTCHDPMCKFAQV